MIISLLVSFVTEYTGVVFGVYYSCDDRLATRQGESAVCRRALRL